MVSEYYWQMDFMKEWYKKCDDIKEDFSEFLEWFFEKNDNFDNHKLPQYNFIEECKNVTIMIFENLDKDFQNFFGEELKFTFLKKNKKICYKNYYTEEAQNKVREYYKNDFEKFDYDIEL